MYTPNPKNQSTLPSVVRRLDERLIRTWTTVEDGVKGYQTTQIHHFSEPIMIHMQLVVEQEQ